MPQYQSPGVYVEEVPSAVQPISGVGTSTAGFIGVIAGPEITVPRSNPDYNPSKGVEEIIQVEPKVAHLVGKKLAEALKVSIAGKKLAKGTKLTLSLAKALNKKGGMLKVEYTLSGKDLTAANLLGKTIPENIRIDDAKEIKEGKVATEKMAEAHIEALKQAKITKLKVEEVIDLAKVEDKYLKDKILAEKVTLEEDAGEQLPKGTTIKDVALAQSVIQTKGSDKVNVQNLPCLYPTFSFDNSDAAKVGEVKLCTNFGQFKKYFGDFSDDGNQNNLAHAVFGFFNNGGARCYVMRYATLNELQAPTALAPFEAVDEIALVAAPGISDTTVHNNLVNHCTATKDRFAILDGAQEDKPANLSQNPPDRSDYAAYYVPWLQVFDPATKFEKPQENGLRYVPPSGHLAGIYARVDTERGVHKAPANEVVGGALGVRYPISKAVQDGLNPLGINCIRYLNGNIRVWGARTIGGDANSEWKYINVRRLFLFLRESIDKGTQWVVFEPNTPELWSKITRNITAFLTNAWRDGALFGSTSQEAFFVKCNEETNPPEVRDQGRVVTEIGVAVVKPAEFVIFRIGQWTGTGS